MDTLQNQFEQELWKLDQEREAEPGYVELRAFFESMQNLGLVTKQPYQLKNADPVVLGHSKSQVTSDSWFGLYLNRHQR